MGQLLFNGNPQGLWVSEMDENKVWIEEWEAQELLSLPLAVYVRFTPVDDEKELLEIVARIRNNQHRSIQPNDLEIRDL